MASAELLDAVRGTKKANFADAAQLVLVLGAGAPLLAHDFPRGTTPIDCQRWERARCAWLWEELAQRLSPEAGENQGLADYVRALRSSDLHERTDLYHPLEKNADAPGRLLLAKTAAFVEFQEAAAELAFLLTRELSRVNFLNPRPPRSNDPVPLERSRLHEKPDDNHRSIAELLSALLRATYILDERSDMKRGRRESEFESAFRDILNARGIRFMLVRLASELAATSFADVCGSRWSDEAFKNSYIDLLCTAEGEIGFDAAGDVVQQRTRGIRSGQIAWLEALLRHSIVSQTWAHRDESEMAFVMTLPRARGESSDDQCDLAYWPGTIPPLDDPRFYILGSVWAANCQGSSASGSVEVPILAILRSNAARPAWHLREHPHRFLTGLARLVCAESEHAARARTEQPAVVLTMCLDDEFERSLSRALPSFAQDGDGGRFLILYPVRAASPGLGREWVLARCSVTDAETGAYKVDSSRLVTNSPEVLSELRPTDGPLLVKLAGAPLLDNAGPGLVQGRRSTVEYVHDLIFDEHDLFVNFINNRYVLPDKVQSWIGFPQQKYVIGARTDVYGRVSLYGSLGQHEDSDEDRAADRYSVVLYGPPVKDTEKAPVSRAGIRKQPDTASEATRLVSWMSRIGYKLTYQQMLTEAGD